MARLCAARERLHPSYGHTLQVSVLTSCDLQPLQFMMAHTKKKLAELQELMSVKPSRKRMNVGTQLSISSMRSVEHRVSIMEGYHKLVCS